MQGHVFRLWLGLFLLHVKGMLNRDRIRLLCFNLDRVLLLGCLWFLCLNMNGMLLFFWVRLFHFYVHNFIIKWRIIHRFVD